MRDGAGVTLAKGWSATATEPSEGKESSIWQTDTEFPLLTVTDSALAHNRQAMSDYVTGLGAHLAPHAKTMMSVEVASGQDDEGAWATTVATPFQLRVLREAGFSRILLANQLVEPTTISWLHEQLDGDESFSAYLFVDSEAGTALLADEAAARPIDVFIEVGHPGGRTGLRRDSDVRVLVEKVNALPGVCAAGLAAYEGTLGGDASAHTLIAVRDFANRLGRLSAELRSEGLLRTESLVTIGGSAFFDEAVAGLEESGFSARDVVLRSGAYIVHDDGFYARMTPSHRHCAAAPELISALTVWAPVLSRPEPRLAILLCGRRDVGSDQGLPVVRSIRARDGSHVRGLSGTVTSLADQHLFLDVNDDAEINVGDIVELGISHPCTTMDKWHVIPVIDDDHRMISTIRTWFS